MALLYPIALGLLFILLSVGFATICVLVGRKLIHPNVSPSHNAVMTGIFASANMVYAVLLGFLVIVVWETYDSAQKNAAMEAATLVPLYRLTYGMTPQSGQTLRGMIRDYSDAVIHDEWPLLGREDKGSRRARRAIGDMDRHFAHLDPATKTADAQINAEFLLTQDSVVAARNQRLLDVHTSIPWAMWMGAIGGDVITIFMGGLLYMSRAWPHLLMSWLAASLTGLLLFMMVALSRPFTGPLAIGPDNFVETLQVINDVDRGY